MTNEEQALAWAQCARHNGDEDAARAIEALVSRVRVAERDLEALRATVDAEPSCGERIHAALIAAGISEEDEVSGVIGLEEHVGRALERLRALEKVRAAASIFGGNSKTLRDAMADADALKVKT